MWEIFHFTLGVFHKLPVFIFKTSLWNVKPLIGMETDFCNNTIIGVISKCQIWERIRKTVRIEEIEFSVSTAHTSWCRRFGTCCINTDNISVQSASRFFCICFLSQNQSVQASSLIFFNLIAQCQCITYYAAAYHTFCLFFRQVIPIMLQIEYRQTQAPLQSPQI